MHAGAAAEPVPKMRSASSRARVSRLARPDYMGDWHAYPDPIRMLPHRTARWQAGLWQSAGARTGQSDIIAPSATLGGL